MVHNLHECGYSGGRVWRSTRDIQNNSWTWLPCGVACCAGELTELSSNLSGATWSTLGVGLRGKGLVRWNSDYSLPDFFGRPTAVGSSSGVTTAIYDAFNVRRGGSATLSRGAIRAILGANDDDGFVSSLASRALKADQSNRKCYEDYNRCMKDADVLWNELRVACWTAFGVAMTQCVTGCIALIVPWLVAPCLVLCGVTLGYLLSVCLNHANQARDGYYQQCQTKLKACKSGGLGIGRT